MIVLDLKYTLTVYFLGIALLGVFGLFQFASRKPREEIRDARLHLLILFIDTCAIGMSIAAATVCQQRRPEWHPSKVEC